MHSVSEDTGLAACPSPPQWGLAGGRFLAGQATGSTLPKAIPSLSGPQPLLVDEGVPQASGGEGGAGSGKEGWPLCFMQVGVWPPPG